MIEKLKVVVDMKTWRRGGEEFDEEHGQTFLLNSKGNMCCLGFVARAYGISEDNIRGVGEPDDIEGLASLEESPAKLYPSLVMDIHEESPFLGQIFKCTYLASKAMLINDDSHLTDEERIVKLKNLFKNSDIELTFE